MLKHCIPIFLHFRFVSVLRHHKIYRSKKKIYRSRDFFLNESIIWVFVVVDKASHFIRSGHCSGMTLSHLVKSGFASFSVLSPVESARSEEKVGRRDTQPARPQVWLLRTESVLR